MQFCAIFLLSDVGCYSKKWESFLPPCALELAEFTGYYAVLSFHCSLLVTCRERANQLAFLYVMFSSVFVTFPCGVLGQVWYLVVSIPDLCLLFFYS